MVTPNNEYLMRVAAEKAISDLQTQVTSAEAAAARAEISATRAEATASKWKRFTLVLIALVVVVAGLGAGAMFGLRQQAVNSCNIGNDRATGIVAALDELVVLLEGPHPTASTKQKAAAYEAFVTAHNQQRDCSRAYSIIP